MSHSGICTALSSFWANSSWPKGIWPEPQDPEGSPSPPTRYSHPSCANRLQLAGSKKVWGEGLAGLTGQGELGFPENHSHPKVA